MLAIVASIIAIGAIRAYVTIVVHDYNIVFVDPFLAVLTICIVCLPALLANVVVTPNIIHIVAFRYSLPTFEANDCFLRHC